MIAALTLALTASSLRFSGFVPPHRAADGVRYRIDVSGSTRVPDEMKACGIDDFEPVRSPLGGTAYQFAVTRSTEAQADCLRGRLAHGARMEKIDSWTPNAQTD